MHKWADRHVGVGRLQPTKGETILLAACLFSFFFLFLRGVQVSLTFCPCALLYCPFLLLCPVLWVYGSLSTCMDRNRARTNGRPKIQYMDKSPAWSLMRRLCLFSVCPVTLLFFFVVWILSTQHFSFLVCVHNQWMEWMVGEWSERVRVKHGHECGLCPPFWINMQCIGGWDGENTGLLFFAPPLALSIHRNSLTSNFHFFPLFFFRSMVSKKLIEARIHSLSQCERCGAIWCDQSGDVLRTRQLGS